MAIIMYFNRAPRIEGVTAKDIKLVESYYAWKKERALDGPYSCDTLEEWCGVPETEMPHKHIVNYLLDYMSPKKMYVEGIGEQERDSIFEQLARIANAPHILKWFADNIMDGNADTEYHEVTMQQLMALGGSCMIVSYYSQYDGERYIVDKAYAEKELPLMGEVSDDAYDDFYMEKVMETAKMVNDILSTTDFETQTIYFNAILV